MRKLLAFLLICLPLRAAELVQTVLIVPTDSIPTLGAIIQGLSVQPGEGFSIPQWVPSLPTQVVVASCETNELAGLRVLTNTCSVTYVFPTEKSVVALETSRALIEPLPTNDVDAITKTKIGIFLGTKGWTAKELTALDKSLTNKVTYLEAVRIICDLHKMNAGTRKEIGL